MTAGQLALELHCDLCDYGLPKLDDPRPCNLPANHRAHWSKADGRVGSIDCCLTHANYYATAWCDWVWAPGSDSAAWLEPLR